MDPILESSGARQHMGEPIAAVGRLGGGEQLPSTANKLATASLAMGGTAGSSGVDAIVTSVMLESRAENLVVLKE